MAYEFKQTQITAFLMKPKAAVTPMPPIETAPQPVSVGYTVPISEMIYNQKKEYQPTLAQEHELRKVFYEKETVEQQYKDLQKTTNVVRTKRQLDLWIKNPRSADVLGIDTAPIGLIESRNKTVNTYLGNVPIKDINRQTNYRGQYSTFQVKVNPETRAPERMDLNDIGKIDMNVKLIGGNMGEQYNRTLSHELGHAYDVLELGYNRMGNKAIKRVSIKQVKATENFTFLGGSLKDLERNRDKATLLIDLNQKSREQVSAATFKYSPYEKTNYKDVVYRESKTELFGNFFSALLNKKELVKREAPIMYKGFKNNNKEILQLIKKSDKDFLAPLIRKK